jgi:hypothetical protein
LKGQYCHPNRGGRKALWKLPPLWKSSKEACGDFQSMISHNCLEKPAHKPLRLYHSFHSAGDELYLSKNS